MSQRCGRKHMRTNNGQFETLYIGRPGSYKYRYNKLLEQQTNSTNPYLQNYGLRSSWYYVRFTRVVCAVYMSGR